MVAGGKSVLFKQELRITFQVIMRQRFIMGNFRLIILIDVCFMMILEIYSQIQNNIWTEYNKHRMINDARENFL